MVRKELKALVLTTHSPFRLLWISAISTFSPFPKYPGLFITPMPLHMLFSLYNMPFTTSCASIHPSKPYREVLSSIRTSPALRGKAVNFHSQFSKRVWFRHCPDTSYTYYNQLIYSCNYLSQKTPRQGWGLHFIHFCIPISDTNQDLNWQKRLDSLQDPCKWPPSPSTSFPWMSWAALHRYNCLFFGFFIFLNYLPVRAGGKPRSASFCSSKLQSPAQS